MPAEALYELAALFYMVGTDQVRYESENKCKALVTRSQPQERDCLYHLTRVLTKDHNNNVLAIFESIYSDCLSAEIAADRDYRVAPNEHSFDITRNLM